MKAPVFKRLIWIAGLVVLVAIAATFAAGAPVLPERHQCVGPILDSPPSQLVQARDLRLGKPEEAEVGVRLAAPPAESLVQ